MHGVSGAIQRLCAAIAGRGTTQPLITAWFAVHG
jgi:hypothetical protein